VAAENLFCYVFSILAGGSGYGVRYRGASREISVFPPAPAKARSLGGAEIAWRLPEEAVVRGRVVPGGCIEIFAAQIVTAEGTSAGDALTYSGSSGLLAAVAAAPHQNLRCG